MNIFRDPIWEGIAAVITIIGAVFAVIVFISPAFRDALRELLIHMLSNKFLRSMVLIIAILSIGIVIGLFISQKNIFTGTYVTLETTEPPTLFETPFPMYNTATAPDATVNQTDQLEPINPEEYIVEQVRIPPGNFLMGSSHTDIYDFHPARSIFISEFYIDKYEVTNFQYSKCVESGVCSAPVLWKSNYRDYYYGNPEYDDFPVIYVTWNNAEIFCKWRGARLPSEAEWEKAARWRPDENRSYIYPWGNQRPTVALTNFHSTDTARVGSFSGGTSPVGALDMAGNVMEWVADHYSRNYYEISPNRDPKGPQTPTGKRVVRGGSWNTTNEADLWSFARYAFDEETNRNDLGFRCASDSSLP